MTNPLSLLPQHADHPRTYRDNKFVYPVLSRRSRGISIGINLNPDKICNFDCLYCQVDRRSDAELDFVDLPALLEELRWTLDHVLSGSLFADPAFAGVPAELRRLNDLAFSGDGEPTTLKNFEEVVERVAELKRGSGLNHVKLVLITNASMFHRATVQRALDAIVRAPGEIWAKLDAGTAEYYHVIERTPIPFARILENLELAARRNPLVIQSLFLRHQGQPPGDAEIDAYIGCLERIRAAGGKLDRVQVYTIARPPADASVTPLSDAEVDAIAARVRAALAIPTESYPGRSVSAG